MNLNKFDDNNIHIFTPSGMWGDNILNLFASHFHLKNQEKNKIIIHTGKKVYNPHFRNFSPADENLFQFWSSFKSVEGILFDVNQQSLNADADASNYKLFPFLDHKIPENYQCDIRDYMDFSLFPKTFSLETKGKIAVLQPVSLKNKPKHLIKHFLCEWEHTVKQLLNNDYFIYLIGSHDDLMDSQELYPFLFHNNQIINLMGQISIFEAMDLVMNKASLVVSCCSWSAWAGIAARVKTVFAAGPLFEDGTEDKYLKLITNKDIYFMDYSSKKGEADKRIAEWIKENV